MRYPFLSILFFLFISVQGQDFQYYVLPTASDLIGYKPIFDAGRCTSIPDDFINTEGSSVIGEDPLFDEVDFEPLQIKVRWCKKVLGVTPPGFVSSRIKTTYVIYT
jgi:hypothetical protein